LWIGSGRPGRTETGIAGGGNHVIHDVDSWNLQREEPNDYKLYSNTLNPLSNMSLNPVFRYGHPVIFTILILFSIVTLSDSAFLVSKHNSLHNFTNLGERDRVRYILFTSIWTLVTAPVFMVLFLLAPIGHPLTSVATHLIYLFITWVLWTAAASAITATLGGGRGLDCGTQHLFVYCGQLLALEAFSWMIWIILTIAIMFVIVRAIMAAKEGEGYSGSLVTEG